MAKHITRSLHYLHLVFLCLCLLGILAHFLADNLDHVGWETSVETSHFDPSHHDQHEDNFLLPGVNLAGAPGGLIMANSTHNSNILSHSISPQLPPPKI